MTIAGWFILIIIGIMILIAIYNILTDYKCFRKLLKGTWYLVDIPSNEHFKWCKKPRNWIIVDTESYN